MSGLELPVATTPSQCPQFLAPALAMSRLLQPCSGTIVTRLARVTILTSSSLLLYIVLYFQRISSKKIMIMISSDSDSSDSDWPEVDDLVFGSSSNKKKKKEEEIERTINDILSRGPDPIEKHCDALDVQIAEQKEKHRQQIRKLDEDAVIQQRRKEDREARYAANAVRRDQLAKELTQPVLKMMFGNILGYLEDIKAGLIESWRHKAYYKSLNTRQALLYKQINNPFTNQQVDWAYKEFADRWLRTKQEHADNNEYIWKVLMPECMIRLYSEFFQVTMKEAEKMIKETPFDSDSDSE